MISVGIQDGRSHVGAMVTRRSELVVGDIDYSEPYYKFADATNTAYNLVPPKTGKRFIVTGFIISANRNVGTTGANIDLYEAASATSTSVTKQIYKDDIAKQTRIVFTGAKMIMTEGTWLNFKTDDDDFHVTVFGYYVIA